MIYSKRINLITIILVLISLLGVILAMCSPWSKKQHSVGEKFFGNHSVTFTSDDYHTEYIGLSSSFVNLTGDEVSFDSKNVTIDEEGNITIIGGGTYIFSGSYNGSVVIDSKDASPVWIVLNGVDINAQCLSSIYTRNAKKTIITAVKDTTNNLTDAEDYSSLLIANDEPDACIFSDSNLTINGSGIINITGNHSHAIVCKKDLKITGGNVNISSVDDAINAYSVYIVGETSVCISSGDDAIHCDEMLGLEAKSINITSCNEGLEGKNIVINSGNYSITSIDDAINAIGNESEIPFFDGFGFKNNEPKIEEDDFYLMINGGTIIIETDGDGIDSNGSILMNGGSVTVYGPENSGNASIDYGDGGYQFVMNGGSLIAIGGAEMAEEFYSESEQITLAYYLDDWYDALSVAKIVDSNGEKVATCTPTKRFNYICISTNTLKEGEVYTLVINNNVIGTLEATGITNSYGKKQRMPSGK